MIQLLELGLLLVIIVKLFRPELVSVKKTHRGRRIVLDSCALIDGRILELARSGFISHELVVPEFVIHELQLLADGVDTHKRERARFGLDVVKDLQALVDAVTVTIDQSASDGQKPTDDKLVALCQKLKASLYTTDFNLQKVAEIKHIQVLNVNDLAQKMRPVALPGERKTVKILQKGSNSRQGVGYLEDGTMIVIEDGAKYIGKTAEVEVTRNHQTVAGKMLFADLISVAGPQSAPAPVKPSFPKLRSGGARQAVRPAARKRV